MNPLWKLAGMVAAIAAMGLTSPIAGQQPDDETLPPPRKPEQGERPRDRVGPQRGRPDAPLFRGRRGMMGPRGPRRMGRDAPFMRGRPGWRARQQQPLSPQECLAFLKEHYPDQEVVQKLQNLVEGRNEHYRRLFRRLQHTVSGWARDYRNQKNRPLVDVKMQTHAIQMRLFKLRRDYRLAGDDDAEREQIETRIRELCATFFEKRIEQKELELQRLEEQIRRVRQKLEQRRQKKDFWIEKLVQEQIGDDFFGPTGLPELEGFLDERPPGRPGPPSDEPGPLPGERVEPPAQPGPQERF